jgi:hypothetical protein
MLSSRLLESRSTTIKLLTVAREVLAKRRSEMFGEQCDRKELLSCARNLLRWYHVVSCVSEREVHVLLAL